MSIHPWRGATLSGVSGFPGKLALAMLLAAMGAGACAGAGGGPGGGPGGGAGAGLRDRPGGGPDAGAGGGNSTSTPPAPSSIEILPPLRPPAGEAVFSPEALAIDGFGRLFALDRAGGRIFRISPDGSWVRFGAGDQGGERYPNLARLFARWGPDLFALDPSSQALFQFDLDGHLRRRLSWREGLAAAEATSAQPTDFALTRSGELLLLDRAGGRLLLFDRNGRYLTDLGAGAAGSERLRSPVRLAVDSGGAIYVLDPPGWIRCFSRQGTSRPAWRYDLDLAPGASRDALIAVTAWDDVVVASRDGRWIRRFTPGGELVVDAHGHNDASAPLSDLAAGPDSLLYLARAGRGEILRLRWIAPDDALDSLDSLSGP